MKKVLFLDDDNQRHREFKKNIGSHGDFVYTAEECIEKLKTNTYDVVSLDHDLGGEIYVSSGGKNTGMEVVRFLEKNKLPQKLIVCHSYNTGAAPEMAKRLNALSYVDTAVRMPFFIQDYKEYFLDETQN